MEEEALFLRIITWCIFLWLKSFLVRSKIDLIEQLDQRQPKNSFKRCFAQVFTFDTVCRTSVIHYRQVHVRCPALILIFFLSREKAIIECEKLEVRKGHWSLESRKDNFRMRLWLIDKVSWLLGIQTRCKQWRFGLLKNRFIPIQCFMLAKVLFHLFKGVLRLLWR